MKSTNRQRGAVRFIERMLNMKFEGNIESYLDCHIFIHEYLEQANRLYYELSSEYEAYKWNKL